jgi:hypothetical protein
MGTWYPYERLPIFTSIVPAARSYPTPAMKDDCGLTSIRVPAARNRSRRREKVTCVAQATGGGAGLEGGAHRLGDVRALLVGEAVAGHRPDAGTVVGHANGSCNGATEESGLHRNVEGLHGLRVPRGLSAQPANQARLSPSSPAESLPPAVSQPRPSQPSSRWRLSPRRMARPPTRGPSSRALCRRSPRRRRSAEWCLPPAGATTEAGGEDLSELAAGTRFVLTGICRNRALSRVGSGLAVPLIERSHMKNRQI